MMKVVVYKAKDSWHYIQFTTKEYKSGTIQEICRHINKDDLVFLLQVSDFIREFDNEYSQKELPSIVDIESILVFSMGNWRSCKILCSRSDIEYAKGRSVSDFSSKVNNPTHSRLRFS